MEWIEQTVIIDHGRVVKQIFQYKPEGRRKTVRPRLRWLEDNEKDLREMRQNDGGRWASLIMEAESLKGAVEQRGEQVSK